jgi:hypothetical protein
LEGDWKFYCVKSETRGKNNLFFLVFMYQFHSPIKKSFVLVLFCMLFIIHTCGFITGNYLVSMDVAHCYLEGNADAVEFCPHNGHHNILAASTYTLEEGDQPSRYGSISLFNTDGDTDNLDKVYSEETSGIFDIKWNPPAGHTSPLLGQADADGYLRIKMLDGGSDGVQGVKFYPLIHSLL